LYKALYLVDAGQLRTTRYKKEISYIFYPNNLGWKSLHINDKRTEGLVKIMKEAWRFNSSGQRRAFLEGRPLSLSNHASCCRLTTANAKANRWTLSPGRTLLEGSYLKARYMPPFEEGGQRFCCYQNIENKLFFLLNCLSRAPSLL